MAQAAKGDPIDCTLPLLDTTRDGSFQLQRQWSHWAGLTSRWALAWAGYGASQVESPPDGDASSQDPARNQTAPPSLPPEPPAHNFTTTVFPALFMAKGQIDETNRELPLVQACLDDYFEATPTLSALARDAGNATAPLARLVLSLVPGDPFEPLHDLDEAVTNSRCNAAAALTETLDPIVGDLLCGP